MRSLAEAWPEDGDCATARCKIALGPQCPGLGPDQGPSHPGVVPSRRARVRLESGCPGSQIRAGLHEREGKALTNFPRELPPRESDMAEQILKDPYNFDFLTVTARGKEREIERGLLTHLRDLLLELGRGFSFVGSQVR